MIILNKSVPTCTIIIVISILKYCKQIPIGVTWTYMQMLHTVGVFSIIIMILCTVVSI